MKKLLISFLILIFFVSIAGATAYNSTYNSVLANGARPLQLALNISNNTVPFANTTHLNIACWQNNCTDISFTLNNATPLPYFRKFNTSQNGTPYGIWEINVTGNGSIQINVGATGVTDASNGTETYPFFDHFTANETSKWSGTGKVVSSYSNSNLTLGEGSCNPTDNTLKTYQGFPTLSEVEYWMNPVSGAGAGACKAWGFGNGVPGSWFTNMDGFYARNDGWVLLNNGAEAGLTNIDASAWKTYTIRRESDTVTRFYKNGLEMTSSPINPAFDGQSSIDFYVGTTLTVDWVRVRNITVPQPTWGTWGEVPKIRIIDWSNNKTNSQSVTFDTVTSQAIRFNITTDTIADSIKWELDGVTQASTYDNYSYAFPTTGLKNITVTVTNISSSFDASKTWNVTAYNYALELLSPANTSTGIATPTTITWRQWPLSSPYTYQVSTDYQFINIVAQGTGVTGSDEIISASVPLANNVHYYWRVKDSTNVYTSIWEFSTTPAIQTPGWLDVQVRNEETNTAITSFNATLVNSTTTITKYTTTGFANFTASEVTNSEYLIIITASGYSTRYLLFTTPGNATVYVPSTTNTINTIAFYLVDYTDTFPWSQSILRIRKNNSIMQSSYFDADAKSTAYLIQGHSYAIDVIYGNTIRNWGNFIPVSSGNVEVTISDIGINASQLAPFTFNITTSTSDIVLKWSDRGSLINFNFTIFKGAHKDVMVHTLTTSTKYGTSDYIVSNTSDIYFIFFSANTTGGWKNQSFAVDYRGANDVTKYGNVGTGAIWTHSDFTFPDWAKTLISITIIILLAGTFGAQNASRGAIVMAVFSMLFSLWGWLPEVAGGIGFVAGFTAIIVLYYIRSQDADVGMMAHKISMFLIFVNFAIIIINASGIFTDANVTPYGNDCQGANINSPECILSRVASLSPSATSESGSSLIETIKQISFLAITATAFGLIMLTLQPMLALLWYGLWISQHYLLQLPIPWYWKLPLSVGVAVVFLVGYLQYKAQSSLKDKE